MRKKALLNTPPPTNGGRNGAFFPTSGVLPPSPQAPIFLPPPKGSCKAGFFPPPLAKSFGEQIFAQIPPSPRQNLPLKKAPDPEISFRASKGPTGGKQVPRFGKGHRKTRCPPGFPDRFELAAPNKGPNFRRLSGGNKPPPRAGQYLFPPLWPPWGKP